MSAADCGWEHPAKGPYRNWGAKGSSSHSHQWAKISDWTISAVMQQEFSPSQAPALSVRLLGPVHCVRPSAWGHLHIFVVFILNTLILAGREGLLSCFTPQGPRQRTVKSLL